MAIQTLDDIIGSAKQRLFYTKTGTQTVVAQVPFSIFGVAGLPVAGTMAGTSETVGVVPVAGDTGYNTLKAITNTGYLQQVTMTASNTCRITLYDRLFVCGAYEHNDVVTLGSQPSFLGRIPGGTMAGCDNETELWVEGVATTGSAMSVEVEYRNSSGVTGRTTGAQSYGTATIANRCMRLPLQSGDHGISRVDKVTGTLGTSGTDCFNVMVLRRLCDLRLNSNNGLEIATIARTAMRQVFDDTAFYPILYSDSTSIGTPDIEIFIMDG